MSDDPVLFDVADDVATLTLNRPGRLNALTADMLRRLRECLAACAAPEIRAVLLDAAGRGFCAGQDLAERDPAVISWPPDAEALQIALYHPIVTAMRELPKPIVVAVNGVAAGAGASLALAGDVVLAAESARFTFAFSRIGLSVDAGAGWQLVRLVGAARARALLLTGGTLDGAEAARVGLCWRCVPDAELAGVARAQALAFAKGPTLAHGLLKQALGAAEGPEAHSRYLQEEARLQGIAAATADYREGVEAFLAKRPPRFTGG